MIKQTQCTLPKITVNNVRNLVIVTTSPNRHHQTFSFLPQACCCILWLLRWFMNEVSAQPGSHAYWKDASTETPSMTLSHPHTVTSCQIPCHHDIVPLLGSVTSVTPEWLFKHHSLMEYTDNMQEFYTRSIVATRCNKLLRQEYEEVMKYTVHDFKIPSESKK